jgi:hypothetical protein
VGLGQSQEAPYSLKADVPAGAYHVICDAVITKAVDVTFDLIWRRGSDDMPLATWTQHFDQLPGGVYTAQAYEVDETAPAIAFKSGDQLVFRYTGGNTTGTQAFIPNGDGVKSMGRIPNITLPQ